MKVLHFSDIHYTGAFDQDRVIDAFCEDIASLHRVDPFHVCLFTGDLASRGGTNSDFIDKIKKNVIDKIVLSIGVDVPIVICPGNHDVDLKARNKIYSSIFEQAVKPGDANELVESSDCEESRSIWAHLSGYMEMAKYIDPKSYSSHQLFYTKIFECGGRRVGVASFNSAWNSKGGGGLDYGKLLVGERQLDLALRELKSCELRLAILHHSDNWLVPSEKPLIQRALSINFHGIFFGHNHETNASSIVGNVGAAFYSNTGCIYESRDYFNGYSIVDYDFSEGAWKVTAREYYSQRNKFDIAPRFAKDGVVQFCVGAVGHPGNIIISSNVINAVQSRANCKLLSYSASEIAPKQVGAIFVEPPLAEQSESIYVANENAGAEKTKPLGINEISVEGKLTLIMGKRESGKTILLHEIAANRYQKIKFTARLGLVVDLSTLPRFTESAILDSAAEFLGNEMPRREIVRLLEAGQVVFCLDNLHLHNFVQVELVRKFVLKFASTRFLVTSHEETVDNLTIEAIPNFGVAVKRVYIHSFRRKQTKELVRKWFGDSEAVSGQKLEIVSRLFAKLNVPRTPFLISVLLWVIEQRPNALLVNQASAIEVLIEGLLEKFKESKARAEFDSTIQQHFLEDLSAHLDFESVEWITSFQFDEFIVGYFKKKGLQVSTRGFAEELIRKGLVYESGDRVAFKFDCFRSYFLARRFANDSQLWKNAISMGRVHRYVTELDLFTGLHRDRKDVLEAVIGTCDELFRKSGFDVDLAIIEELGRGKLPLNDEKIASLETDILSSDKKIQEKFLTDSDVPSSVSINHDEGRKRRLMAPSSFQTRFMESLRALSIILRNSELVDDVGLKRKAFGLTLDYWAKVMVSGLVATKKENLISEMERLPEEVQEIGAEKLSLLMSLIIPSTIQSMLSESLATPKLQLFFSERVNDKVIVIRMFAIFLSLDNGAADSLRVVGEFLKEQRKNSTVVQCIFFKLLGLYMQKSSTGAASTSLRECLADAFSVFRGAGMKANSVEKAQFLQGLDRKVISSLGDGVE